MSLSLALIALTLLPQSTPVLTPHQPIRLGDDDVNAWREPFFPGATYDGSVAHPERVLGQPIGSRLASHEELLRMLRAMASTSERMSVVPYGRTYEGRELVVCLITSAANHGRLDEIQSAAQDLWDPRGKLGLDELMDAQPGIAWMGYGIHGDETSASEASVPFAYHLAACTDAEVTDALEQVVVVLDPCLNPDGRERIRSMVIQSAGFRANLDNGSMQRGRWPGGRGNHYLFDMNRDWMAGEAPETRARWEILRAFPPQLFVDAHEMSGLDTFLFYPQAAPRNRHLPPRLTHWQSVLAADAGRAFDTYGWGYYTREWADALYPGYSDAWGSLTGAIGMLYEQGRTIGAPLKRESGEIVAYRETVHGQVVASFANFLSFAANRRSILEDYVAHRRHACDPEAADGRRAFVVVPSKDVERDARFMRALLGQGIEVERASDSFAATGVLTVMGERLETRQFPAGSWIVPAAQPQGAMVRTYLEFDPRLDVAFLQEERESIERDRGSKVYDVTAWSLARQLGLMSACWIDLPEVARVPATPVSAVSGTLNNPGGAYAWIADGADGRSLRFAARAMELGLQVHLSDKAFDLHSGRPEADGTQGLRSFPRGSFVLRRHENPDDFDALVERAARESRARVFGLPSGRAPGEGPDLGGGHFGLLKLPKVALLSNTPVSSAGFGHIWRYLDEDLAMPVTLVDAQAFRSIDLDDYNVFLLPPGAGSFVKERAKSLESWVRAGGTLIAIGSSAFALADEDTGLSGNRRLRDVLDDLKPYAWRANKERAAFDVSIDTETLYGEPVVVSDDDTQAEDDIEAPSKGADEKEGEEAEALDAWRRRFSPAGVILRGEVNPESWLTSGFEHAELPVLFAGSSVLLTEERPAIRLAPSGRLRLGGLLWPEARKRIADSAWLVTESLGDGRVISFAASPVFRGSWRGTARLLGNAVVLGVR